MSEKGKRQIFYGWRVVLSASLAQSMRGGLGLHTFGLFFKPMSDELGWTRSMLTGALMTRIVLGTGMGPVAGYVIDKFGPRLLMAGGAIMFGLSAILISQTQNIWQFTLFFGVVGAFGFLGLSHIVTTPLISKWFVSNRGKALGITNAASNVGQFVMTPIILYLIAHFGWRGAWVVLGFSPWVLVVAPVLLWAKRQPEDLGLYPDGVDPELPQSATSEEGGKPLPYEAADVEASWTAKAASRTLPFWLLIGSDLFSSIAGNGAIVHRIPYMTDRGFSPAQAATTFVIFAVSAFAAKLIIGPIADKHSVRFLSIGMMLVSAAGLVFLIQAKGVWQLYIGFGVIYGFGGGLQNVIPSLMWGKYYGRRFSGTIRGLRSMVFLVGEVGGPMFAAIVFDTTTSYYFAFSAFIGCFLASSLLLYFAQPPVPILSTASIEPADD